MFTAKDKDKASKRCVNCLLWNVVSSFSAGEVPHIYKNLFVALKS